MMLLTIVSDTHNRHDQLRLPGGNLLIHCGDATGRGAQWELVKLGEWFEQQFKQYDDIVFVPGNHEIGWESNPALKKSYLPSKVHVGMHDYLEIQGLKIFGTSYQPVFFNWEFNYPEEELVDRYEDIPEGLDILITHCPPHGILDVVRGQHVGSTSLMKRVDVVKPKIHCFGHIHPAFGTFNGGTTTFYNAAVCNDDYQIANDGWSFIY